MINIQILTNKASSHIAEMMVVDTNMGVIYTIKSIRKYSSASPQIIELME